jgi:hypothetical protein
VPNSPWLPGSDVANKLVQGTHMSERAQYSETDPRHHTLKIRQMLHESQQHIRDDIAKVSDPEVQALFETSAEGIGGLITAYEHFEQRSEPAWR